MKNEFEKELLEFKELFPINEEQWYYIKKNLQKRMLRPDNSAWRLQYFHQYEAYRHFSTEWLKKMLEYPIDTRMVLDI